MLKDEQNHSYNGGGNAMTLKTWSDFSSLQYNKQCSFYYVLIYKDPDTLCHIFLKKKCTYRYVFISKMYHTVRMKSLTMFLGALHLLHNYKSSLAHILAF